jgi:ATP-dependent Zn protease
MMLGFLVGRFRPAPTLESAGLTARQIEQVAYHEAGHAIAICALGRGHTLAEVAIGPTKDGSLGFVRCVNRKMNFTSSDLDAELLICVAGRAAEEAVFGQSKISTLCGSDLHRATSLAMEMVCHWGFGASSGLFSLSPEKAESYPDIRQEGIRILDGAYRKAIDMMISNRIALDQIARRLVEIRRLDGDEVRRLAGV